MKVSVSSGVGSAQGARGSARPTGGGFSIPTSAPATETSAMSQSAGPGPVSSLDALLALQSVGSPLERRRRAVGRAGRILDVLDDLKISILEGGMTYDALGRLMSAVKEQRDGTDDKALEGVLDEIETRAAVELAKLGAAA